MTNISPSFAPITSIEQAVSVAHTLSEPSKMPCYGYSIPAQFCVTGQKLAELPGTVCSKCYAMKGHYPFKNVQTAMMLRMNALQHPQWVEAMAYQIGYHADRKRKKPILYFRWHDSGDIQGLWHLEKIAEVARRTPKVKHWLPTREIGFVREYLAKYRRFPYNLIVRLSAPTIGGHMSSFKGLPTSSVGDNQHGFQCGAYKRGGKCGKCRACWTDANVNYPLH